MADPVAESLGKILRILRGEPKPAGAQIERQTRGKIGAMTEDEILAGVEVLRPMIATLEPGGDTEGDLRCMVMYVLQAAAKERKPTDAHIDALVQAMSQVLCDMGPGTIKLDVCLLTKARARVAFDPWIGTNDRDIMSLDDARQIVAVCEA